MGQNRMKDTVVGRKNTPVKQNINRASKSFEIGVTKTGDDKIKIEDGKIKIEDDKIAKIEDDKMKIEDRK